MLAPTAPPSTGGRLSFDVMSVTSMPARQRQLL
ncbi:hypothetical protein N181_25710 [Sinorhizobium fredii USDA 205]|nr:hypothetical protein N181_25710 [Sinorhizobium fredii USDA 205]